MADFEEKRYSIDPGKGKKMDGCPYSNFEDGHDVQDYIIPPKGYVFSGFRFDPDANNQIYDGKLYAQYTKEPFKIRLKSNMWKLVLVAIIVVVIGLITLLATSIFKGPGSKNNAPKEPKTEVSTKPSKELEKTDNSLSKTTKRKKRTRKERKREKETSATKTDNKTNTENAQQKQEPVTNPQEPATQKQDHVVKPQEPVAPAVTDPTVYFKQEFWALIHQRVASMDDYTDLYNSYKTKVTGEEFDYLRFTILKNYVSFKEWYDKLKAIPDNKLTSINSISELSKLIN